MNKIYKSTLYFSILSFSTLFADTLYVNIPKVPKTPKVNVKILTPIQLETETQKSPATVEKKSTVNKPIGFSKRVPPSYYKEELSQKSTTNVAQVSTFLELPILAIESITKNLQDNGFTILSQYKIDKKASVISIVFTSPTLITNASKANRGFASTLRILINKNSGIMSITNPLYILKAFMQEEYNPEVLHKTMMALNSAFKNLKDSNDIVKFSKLVHYRYMDNMPFYQDMQTIASADNKTLLAHARKSKKIVYEHTLDNGSIVIGIALSKRTSKFVKKIGYQNAGLLPYPILIENNTAKILSPQYYIAIMYPMLNMTQFMSIASVPGAIVKDCGRVFR